MTIWTAPRLWGGETVVVMASGPSMSKEDADAVRDFKRIVINNTWKLAKDAEVLYAADSAWWRENSEVLSKFQGLKVSITQLHGQHPYIPDEVLVLRATGADGFDPNPANLRTGGNSGYQGIHLAVHLGAKKIILLGYDMRGSHWHGKHTPPLKNPREEHFVRWLKRYKQFAKELERLGVDVVNCSRDTALEWFRRAPLEQEIESSLSIQK